jgi:hypothetical protein
MITFLYTCRDAAVNAYLPLFPARSHGEAIRIFTDAVNDPKSSLHPHARDYTLFCVGAFDDNTGLIDPREPERLLGGSQAIDQLIQ